MKYMAVLILTNIVSCASLMAQPFEIEMLIAGLSSSISRGGAYELSGSIGNHEDFAATGAVGFVLSGGQPPPSFVITTDGSPSLQIRFDSASGALTLSWPNNAADYDLQFSPVLVEPNAWTNVENNSVSLDAANNVKQVVVPLREKQAFYRLRKKGVP